MKIFLILLMLMGVIGCFHQAEDKIKNVYSSRREILSVFGNKSVFRDQSRETVFLYTYSNTLKNEYVFRIKGDKCVLYRDKILFYPDSVLGIEVGEAQLNERIQLFLQKMDSLDIRSISSEFRDQGVDLKIYMKARGIVIYVSNKENLKDNEWKNYVYNMNQLDENWYYSFKEN